MSRMAAMRDLSESLQHAAPPLRRRLNDRLRDLGLDAVLKPGTDPARAPQAVELEHALARGSRTDIAGLIADPSRPLPRSSLTMLVELAASDRLLREALCMRPDLGEDIAARLWPYLTTGQRLRLLDAGRALLPQEMEALGELAAAGEEGNDADIASLARRFDIAGLGAALAGIFAAPAFDCLALVANRYVRGVATIAALLDAAPDRSLRTLEALLWLRGRIVGVVDRRKDVSDLRLARRLVLDAQSAPPNGGSPPAARSEAQALMAALRERCDAQAVVTDGVVEPDACRAA